uniref:Acylphosphatase 2, muscle type n=1 Tax=Oreochromis niloticus TaxID=8128 RepID=I3KV25_ORENI
MFTQLLPDVWTGSSFSFTTARKLSHGTVNFILLEVFCSITYTEDHGHSLGLSGWVKNTRQGTVIGQVQGPWDKVSDMKHWLKSVGSPSSRIDRAVFSNERDISKVEIHGFSTRY